MINRLQSKRDSAARRLGERRDVKIKAQIVDGEGFLTDITVIDISSSGARIEIPWGATVGKRCTLRMSGGSKTVEAEVVWRQAFEVGVRFVESGLPQAPISPPAPAPASPALAPASPARRSSLEELRKIAGITRR